MIKNLKKMNPWWFKKFSSNSKKRNFYLEKLKNLLQTKEILTIS